MTDSGLVDEIRGALGQLFQSSGIGDAIRDIWQGFLGPIELTVIQQAAQKLALTRHDGQQHSFMLVLPVTEAHAAMACNVWPDAADSAAPRAEQQLNAFYSMFAEHNNIDGVFQLDLFAGDASALEARLSWIPFPRSIERLPRALRNSIYPWSTPASTAEVSEELPAGAPDIVTLARITWNMTGVLRHMLASWPDDSQLSAADYRDARAPLPGLVAEFNETTVRLGLGHEMPVLHFDPTWLPHNIRNALQLESITNSLKADLERVWGLDGRAIFEAAWEAFAESPSSEPAGSLLEELAGRSVSNKNAAPPPGPPSQIDVFISYAWSDKTRGARDIYETVRGAGLVAWLDEEQRPSEERLHDDIAEALFQAQRVLICLSSEMLTRGGYALREVLLACQHARPRCLLVLLDRTPTPGALADLPAVQWFLRDGPERLREALAALSREPAAQSVSPTPTELRGSWIDALVAPFASPGSPPAAAPHSGRLDLLLRKGGLFAAARAAYHATSRQDYDTVLELAANHEDLLDWSRLDGAAVRSDPMILGASLRVRQALYVATVQRGAGSDWQSLQAAAFDVLESFARLDTSLLRLDTQRGWQLVNCRLAIQDCLDVFRFAADWFRGWSPRTLSLVVGVAEERTGRIEGDVQACGARLGDLMLGLRALEDLTPEDANPSWGSLWSGLRDELDELFQPAGRHPVTQAVFGELSQRFDDPTRNALAVALADGVWSAVASGDSREELAVTLGGIPFRVVVRCRRARGTKIESMNSVRGTVLQDLGLRGNAPEADVNVLIWAFVEPGESGDEWRGSLSICKARSPHVEPERLPAPLSIPIFMTEMLNDEERRWVADRWPGGSVLQNL